MLKKIARLSIPVYRRFSGTSLTLDQVMKYKVSKNTKPVHDEFFEEDKAEIKRILNQASKNKLYNQIQNDWKSNLIKKEKKREQRIQQQKEMSPIVVEDPKFIVHR
jgi:uncharacterized protein with gpF-like domain